jgi:redox-sensing transcriptional repressor
MEQLRHILKLHREWDVVIIGAGHMGQALANYRGFGEHGFRIMGIFDSDPNKIGMYLNNLTVQDTRLAADFVRQQRIKMAMLAIPAEVAQNIADQLVAAGVQAILNYAPINLNVPPQVQVQNIDPVGKLQHMTYYINEEPLNGK